MKEKKIISFAGRLQSGKTELATICEKFGYERLYFAKPLKMLIASLIGGTIEDVNKYKNGIENGVWQKEIGAVDCIFIHQQTKIPLEIIKEQLLGKIFRNTRDMLQIIGTDVIRTYNSNWHVDKTISMIEEGKKYVIDDVRFTNEKKAIEDIGGDIWFVVRPKINNISHHISEETLKFDDFNNIIINKYSLDYLLMTWEIFMENGYENSIQLRNEQLFKLFNNEEYKEAFFNNTDPFNPLKFLMIHKDLFTYLKTYKNNTNIKDIEVQDDNSILVKWKDKERDYNIVNNALEIEDLKFYI